MTGEARFIRVPWARARNRIGPFLGHAAEAHSVTALVQQLE